METKIVHHDRLIPFKLGTNEDNEEIECDTVRNQTDNSAKKLRENRPSNAMTNSSVTPVRRGHMLAFASHCAPCEDVPLVEKDWYKRTLLRTLQTGIENTNELLKNPHRLPKKTYALLSGLLLYYCHQNKYQLLISIHPFYTPGKNSKLGLSGRYLLIIFSFAFLVFSCSMCWFTVVIVQY